MSYDRNYVHGELAMSKLGSPLSVMKVLNFLNFLLYKIIKVSEAVPL